MTAEQALRTIQCALSGQEWDANSLSEVADILRQAGYPIEETLETTS